VPARDDEQQQGKAQLVGVCCALDVGF